MDGTEADDRSAASGLRLALIILAVVPALFAGLTYTYNDQLQPFWQDIARWYSLPVMAAELVVILIALASGATLRGGLQAIPNHLTFVLLALVVIAVGTAALVANAPLPAQIRTTAWIIHLAFGLAMADLVGRAYHLPIAQQIWRWLALGFIIYFIALLAFIVNIPDREKFDWGRFLFGVLNIRQLGFYSGVGFAVAIGVALTSKDARWRWGMMLIAAALIWISFWTGTRSSLVGVGFALLLGIVLVDSLRSIKAWALIGASLVLGFALAFVHPPEDPAFTVYRLYDSTLPKGEDADMTSGRLEMWKGTATAILERPVFGHGESQFATDIRKISLGYNHPHNAFLQMAYQWGIVGALAFFALLFVAWWRVVGVARALPELGIPSFLVLTSMFGMAMLEGSLYHTWPVMMMVFAIAIALGGSRTAQS